MVVGLGWAMFTTKTSIEKCVRDWKGLCQDVKLELEDMQHTLQVIEYYIIWNTTRECEIYFLCMTCLLQRACEL